MARDKTISTTAGDLTVKIAKARNGSFFPSLLTPRRRIDVALYAVVMEAYVHGASTRKVDDMVAALGVDAGISKSEVSRICADLDTDVAVFQGRELNEQAPRFLLFDVGIIRGLVARRGCRLVACSARVERLGGVVRARARSESSRSACR